MRTRNSFFNFLANTGSTVINIILSFICRTVFIAMLGKTYLGVNGLFSNILSVLSLAELGIGGAMIFHMYEPVAKEDHKATRELMNLYKRLYAMVALVIAVAGVCLTPFLGYLIKDQNDTGLGMDYLTIVYLLYLFNTVSSYFFCYKRSITEAHQKAYINVGVGSCIQIVQFIVQILVLVLTKNFIAYLLVQIACNVLTNILTAYLADRLYPYMKEDRKSLPPKETRKHIYKHVGAMFLHRLGDVVVNNTDNLIMSAFVGLGSVGIYSNYLLIETSINTALNGVFGAFTASVGNLGATENKEHVFRVYKVINFLGFVLYGYCTIAFLVMYNPFIEVWAGADYLFPMSIVLIMEMNFYVRGMRKATLTFRDAMGLYWYDRYKPIFEVIINLVVSLVLVMKIGVAGILLGTLISNLSTCFWIEPLVTYRYGFEQKVSHFFKTYAVYTLTVVGVGGFTYWLCDHFTMGGITEVIWKLIVCTVVYNGIVVLLYYRTDEFQELWKQSMLILQHRKSQKTE